MRMTLTMFDLMRFLENAYPLFLAEEWDNVGLLVGERGRNVKRVMTCLSVTEETVVEATEKKVDLIVSHHPFPFHAAKKWTSGTPDGRLLLALARNDIALYSPHTSHDSAAAGINEQLAQGLGLVDREPLCPGTHETTASMFEGVAGSMPDLERETGIPLGTGRLGRLPKPETLERFMARVARLLHVEVVPYAGAPERLIRKVAIGCGAADDFLDRAVEKEADVFLTGEARFHSYLRAKALWLALVAPGHYATERFAMERMADRIQTVFPELTVFVSGQERDAVSYWFADRTE